MYFWLAITAGGVGSCSSAVVKYVLSHLQSPDEAGCLAMLPDYRDESGLIRPHHHNLQRWYQVGHSPGISLQPKLLWNLSMGMDLFGNQLTLTEIFQGPVEAIITLPSELSHALADDPQAAYPILWAGSSAYLREVERFAVSMRVGRRNSECRPAQTLSLSWFHALNKAGEPHFQAHVLTFAPASFEGGSWLGYVNREFMINHLHAPGGAREKVTEAVVAEAARHGYVVEVLPGKANPDQHHGARVTCPDGTKIDPGSIPHRAGAEVHARVALFLELGVSWLTTQELQLVRNQAGQYPVAAAGGQRQENFHDKLKTLDLLDSEGRITRDLVTALSRLDVSLARVEASLRNLPFMEWELASLAVRAKREELHEQVPEICTDDWEARRTWTITLDEMLELVASGKGHWADLSTTTKNFLHLLERAGVVKKHWELGLPTYRLTEKGEAHRQVGLQEIQEMHAVVPELFALVTTEQAPPEMIVGRLQHAGVHLRGSRLEFRRLGRSLEAGEQIRAAGIDPLTPMIPDFDWWQWYWRRRYELPPILARVVLRPDELPAQWPVGPLDVQKSTLVSSPSVQEAFHCKTRKSTPRHPVIPVQPQETPSLTPSAAPQVNQEEKPDGHKR